jgi:hypothetical protein
MNIFYFKELQQEFWTYCTINSVVCTTHKSQQLCNMKVVIYEAHIKTPETTLTRQHQKKFEKSCVDVISPPPTYVGQIFDQKYRCYRTRHYTC